MEFELLLKTLGIDVGMVTTVSVGVMLITQKIKTEIPWFTGFKTSLLSLGVAFAISFMTYANGSINWKAIIVTTLVCWLLPGGTKELLKNLSSGNNSRGITG